MKTIHTEKAPAAIGPYSQGMIIGNLVFTSGQIPADPATGAIVGETIEEQAKQSIVNVGAILEAAGTSFDKVIKTTCFLADMNDFFRFQRSICRDIYFKTCTLLRSSQNVAEKCVV